MTPQRLFVHKMTYVVAIAVLLLPLYMLSHPATTSSGDSPGSPGGQLAQLRAEHKLSQAQLGEIDPASEAAKLATLGMRGVATNILWHKAGRYKMRKDWSNLSATLNQITRLQPNFITVWQYQSWNLSYNVSAEFDDYQERYRWIIKGIEFLIRGIDYNDREPRLPDAVGRMLTTKMGYSDESKEFRPMFKADNDYHEKQRTPSVALRDSWLNSQMWYRQAEDLVKQGLAPLEHAAEIIFYSSAPMCQMNYAEAIEKEGTFGEKARQEWAKAARQWRDYGTMRFPTIQLDDKGDMVMISLNDEAVYAKLRDQYKAELFELQPGLRDELRWQAWNQLSREEKGTLYDDLVARDPEEPNFVFIAEMLDKEQPNWQDEMRDDKLLGYSEAQRKALDQVEILRTAREKGLASDAESDFRRTWMRARQKIDITFNKLALAVQGPDRAQALQLGEDIMREGIMSSLSRMEGEVVAFEFWKMHAESQQSDHALAAHKAIFDARSLYAEGALADASREYLKCMGHWDDLLTCGEYPELLKTKRVTREVLRLIEKYMVLLDQLDEIYPKDNPLQYVVRQHVDMSGQSPDLYDNLRDAELLVQREDYATALLAYEIAVSNWKNMISELPALELMGDWETGEEILATLREYVQVLDKLGKQFPDDLPLRDFIRLQINHAPELAAARSAQITASRYLDSSKFPEAQEAYEEAMTAWQELLDRFTLLYHEFEPAVLGEIDETLAGYQTTLDRRGTEAPQTHPLKEYITRRGGAR